MKQKTPAPDETLNRLLRAAVDAWQRGDHSAYLDLMRQATRLDPKNPSLLVDTGAAYAGRYDYAAAEACFERAVSIATDKFALLERIALLCRNFDRYDLATRFLERAAGRREATADTLTKLAEMYERLRRADDARRTVERALRLEAANPLALLVSARLARSDGQVAAAERTVRSFLDRSDEASWSTRIRGWYELGANLDHQGRYDEAMSALLTAKSLIRPHAGKAMASQAVARAKLAVAAREISAAVLQRWADEAAAADPAAARMAVIAGHPRSGTTLLEQVLDAHPGIVSAEETAIFFNIYKSLGYSVPAETGMVEMLEASSPASLDLARAWYRHALCGFLGQSLAGQLVMDKNPSLTGLIPALVRLVPGVRFVIALRDPRDVCLSCFLQPLPLNPVSSSFLSLEEAAAEYVSLMGFWRALAPRLPEGMAIELRYEDVVCDLNAAARRTLHFLDVPWDERVLRFDQHARQKLVRSPTYGAVAKPLSNAAIGRWRHYEKYIEPCLERLGPFISAFGYNS